MKKLEEDEAPSIPEYILKARREVHLQMVFEGPPTARNASSGGGPSSNALRWDNTSRWRDDTHTGFSTAVFQGAKAGNNDRIMADLSHRGTGSVATGLGFTQAKEARPGKYTVL